VDWDADQLRQWAGEDIDLTRPLSSGHIAAAADFDPSLFAVVGPYLMMLVLPEALRSVEPRARQIYAQGWRPAMPAGPNSKGLAELIAPLAAAGRPSAAAPAERGQPRSSGQPQSTTASVRDPPKTTGAGL
jgi:hypothetical protein